MFCRKIIFQKVTNKAKISNILIRNFCQDSTCFREFPNMSYYFGFYANIYLLPWMAIDKYLPEMSSCMGRVFNINAVISSGPGVMFSLGSFEISDCAQ